MSLRVCLQSQDKVHHLPLFAVLFLTLYRANSARTRQIDEFEGALFIWKRADRSTSSQLLKAAFTHLPFFRCFVLTLYRANSARNRQIHEFADSCAERKPADRWIFSQFDPMILKRGSLRQDRDEPSSPSPIFRCFVLTLYRANSARNRQIDEFAVACFESKPADRSVNALFNPMILKAYRNIK